MSAISVFCHQKQQAEIANYRDQKTGIGQLQGNRSRCRNGTEGQTYRQKKIRISQHPSGRNVQYGADIGVLCRVIVEAVTSGHGMLI